MAEYKCICCGEVINSETTCTCPICGYKMVELPYNRKEVLIEEIRSFLKALRVNQIIREDLIFVNKDKDDKRFPSFEKIQEYVAKQEKTEDFIKALKYSVENIQVHYRNDFSKTYKTSMEFVDNIVQKKGNVLKEAMYVIEPNGEYSIADVKWPSVEMIYSERIDKYLASSARELLDSINKVSEKIEHFIRFNNLYGASHSIMPSDGFKKTDGSKIDYKEELEKCIEAVDHVLRKKYELDILDDGEQELTEMLTCLWNSIEMIMRAPILMPFYEYKINGSYCSETEGLERLTEVVNSAYSSIDKIILDTYFLSNFGEDKLLDLYDKMVALDQWGYMGVNSADLIHIGASEKALNELIGLSSIKDSILKIKAYAINNKDSDALNVHMCFYGNPGTGKTEVARIIAGILHENGILPTDKVVEVDKSGLVGQYLGETPQKTMRVINQAMGGVLFIDEAYALAPKGSAEWDYGHEAISTLIKAMEDYRGEFCVIFAGYRNEMEDMMSANPGFKSRIQFELDFPNYSRSELKSITELMLRKRKYSISDPALEKMLDITDVKRKDTNFANAREIRNILDQIIMCQNVRTSGTGNNELEIVDVKRYISDSGIILPIKNDGINPTILSAEEELEMLVGLESVKRMIKKIKAYAKKNMHDPDFNLHMCFYGNPGTGKTEVARLLSRILYEAGVLKEAKVIETDSNGLIGQLVGQTAPKTEAKIKDAMGGVLFIDEAYGLKQNEFVKGYGDEAIAVLLKAMEDYRGKFCTILAGYRDEMQIMLASNPGFDSRIQFKLDFPDYTREELGEIANHFAEKKNYNLTSSALDKILDIAEHFRNKPNFANARTIRNILDQVIMNQNLRTEDDDSMTIEIEDVLDYIDEEKICIDSSSDKKHIGFI